MDGRGADGGEERRGSEGPVEEKREGEERGK